MPWSPMADFRETDDAYLINAELPGLHNDHVNGQGKDHRLGNTGEIREDRNGSRRHRSSRRMGRFEYRTYLPGDIKPDQVSAKLHDGILTVTVPKSEAAKPRPIEVIEE